MISPTLLILAAGMGNRYGGLKQMDPVGPNGETIMDYSIYDALRAGFSKLVFVIRKDIERQFKEIVTAHFEKLIPVQYVFQELDDLPPGFSIPVGRSKPWGTTHAVLAAASVIHEPFAVINADDYYGPDSFHTLGRHLQTGTTDYAMVGFILRNTLSDFGTVSRGVCQAGHDDLLQGVVELTHIMRSGVDITDTDAAGRVTRLTGSEVVSMNMWGFTPQVFEQLKEHFQRFLELNILNTKSESYLPSVVNNLVMAGQARVKVLRTKDSWSGITYREDRPHVVESIRRLIDNGTYPERLWP